MRAIAFATIYLAQEVGNAIRRANGTKIHPMDGVVDLLAMLGFIVCIIIGD